MKKSVLFLLLLFILSIIISSCTKNNLKDSANMCIDNFDFPIEDSIETNSYFKGIIGDQNISIFNESNNYYSDLKSVLHFTSLPGEEINPLADSLKNKKIGLRMTFVQRRFDDFPVIFGIATPYYHSDKSFISIIDSLLKNKNLLIGDDNNKLRGYTFYFTIPCAEYDLSPLTFATGYKWGKDYYYDQVNKWIKIIDFKKEKTILGYYIYDITFDLNVNVFTRRGYYGEVKGIFKTHFVLQ